MSLTLRLIIPCAAILAVALAVPSPAAAQAPGAKADKRARPGKRAQHANPAALSRKRAKVRQRIRALRAWRLTEALDLDENTAARLFPVLNRFDSRFAKGMKRGASLRKQMRQAMRKKASHTRTNKLIDQMVAQRKVHWRLQEERFKAVRAVLTPTQAATILVLLPEIDRKILRQVRRAMKKRRRAGQTGRPGVKDPFGGNQPRRHQRRPFTGNGGDQKLINPFDDSARKRRKQRKRRKSGAERGEEGVTSPF